MGTLTLPTSGTLAGLTAVQDINAANAALATASQGGTAPTPASTGLSSTAGLLWHDTTNNLLKLRNQADTGWITVGSFDEGQLGFVPYYEGVALPTLLRGYIAGLNLSNDTGAPNTKIDVSSGVCVDDTSAAMMNLGTSVIDCTTVGVNGLDAGSLAASTWYNAFAICKAGGAAPALLASTSLVSPVMPSGYTLKRRLGSFRTDGAVHVQQFVQFGDEFVWVTAFQEYTNDTTLGNTQKLYPLNGVPPGVKTLVRIRTTYSGTNLVQFRSPDETGALTVYAGATFEQLIRTSTSQQVAAISNAASGNTLSIATAGYFDYRGRFN